METKNTIYDKLHWMVSMGCSHTIVCWKDIFSFRMHMTVGTALNVKLMWFGQLGSTFIIDHYI